MTLAEFLALHNLSLDPKIVQFCEKGITIFKESKDPFHDETHVYRLLDTLTGLLKSNELHIKKIDMTVLLLSICWHDTWRAQQEVDRGRELLIVYLWDGRGSGRLFKREAAKAEIPMKIIHQTQYVIRKHNDFQFFTRKTLEAKILLDLDRLDIWSPERLSHVTKKSDHLKFSKRMILLTRLYIKFIMGRARPEMLYFEWSKKKFVMQKESTIESISSFISKHI